jgi:hypothetical protein
MTSLRLVPAVVLSMVANVFSYGKTRFPNTFSVRPDILPALVSELDLFIGLGIGHGAGGLQFF